MLCSIELLGRIVLCFLLLPLVVNLVGCSQHQEVDSWFADMAARDPGELCAGNKNPPDCFLRTQFSSGHLPVGFEIRDGLGSFSLTQSPGRLRYQVSGTREKQAGDGDTPGFEYHGYA